MCTKEAAPAISFIQLRHPNWSSILSPGTKSSRLKMGGARSLFQDRDAEAEEVYVHKRTQEQK